MQVSCSAVAPGASPLSSPLPRHCHTHLGRAGTAAPSTPARHRPTSALERRGGGVRVAGPMGPQQHQPQRLVWALAVVWLHPLHCQMLRARAGPGGRALAARGSHSRRLKRACRSGAPKAAVVAAGWPNERHKRLWPQLARTLHDAMRRCSCTCKRLTPHCSAATRGRCRWCGLLIDARTLEIQADYGRYAGSHVAQALTVPLTTRPGQS